MKLTNQEIARRLREKAHSLSRGGKNLYRIRSYRRAAETLMGLDEQIASVYEIRGVNGLDRIPGLGKKLVATITRYLEEDHDSTGLSST